MTDNNLARLLDGVPRYRLTGYDAGTQPDGAGDFVAYREVLAALSAAPPMGVKVKPLVWLAKSEWHHIAENPFGECWIKHYNGMGGLWTLYGPGHYGPNNNFPTLDAAKAAAQADYEARILAALSAPHVNETPKSEHDGADVLTALPADELRRAAEPDNFDQLVADGVAEAMKAMRKFPQPNYVISKIAEEAGEVVKAAIHAAEGRETVENLRGEMKQLIAMLYRLWIEGDGVHGLGSVSLSLIEKDTK